MSSRPTHGWTARRVRLSGGFSPGCAVAITPGYGRSRRPEDAATVGRRDPHRSRGAQVCNAGSATASGVAWRSVTATRVDTAQVVPVPGRAASARTARAHYPISDRIERWAAARTGAQRRLWPPLTATRRRRVSGVRAGGAVGLSAKRLLETIRFSSGGGNVVRAGPSPALGGKRARVTKVVQDWHPVIVVEAPRHCCGEGNVR
jgi:hypothetical protein